MLSKRNPSSYYIEGILNKDRFILSRAITLLESKKKSDRSLGLEVLDKLMPHTGNSIRIGITGVPGVGKSSFIEKFGIYLCEQGKHIAVLAVDPSSKRSGGSILGDKTRMEALSNRKEAFIRPSPSGLFLGGVAQMTRESMLLCEAAGFDIVLIETVGVGQSEISVYGMVDFFLLLMLAGSGDELQGVKRGIMEMADAVVITKADGDNMKKVNKALSDFKMALHLFPARANQWIPPVLSSSSINNEGMQEIWEQILSFENLVKSNSHFYSNRRVQLQEWMHDSIKAQLEIDFYRHPILSTEIKLSEQKLSNSTASPSVEAQRLLQLFYSLLSESTTN